MTEHDLDIACAKEAKRGLDKSMSQSLRRDEGAAGSPPARQRFAGYGTGEAGTRLDRVGVERREPERPRQPMVERPFAFNAFADRLVLRAPQQAGNGKVIAGGR